ncbi:MAG: hypothetical protein HRU20_18640 [Pseudomonadales bacterium]|nr:hypothetical protein [Pseudomonadales bacterium]
MNKLISIFLIVFCSNAIANDETTTFTHGLWQSSYAYLGKQPFYNNYIIITDEHLIVETNGSVNSMWRYEVKVNEGNYQILEIIGSDLNGKYVRLNRNEKYGCKPKSRLSYDKKCNSHIWDNVFDFCIYNDLGLAVKNEGKCKRKDKYFTFKPSQVEKIRLLSENI